MINKKGVSSVVATVLIILLTVVAVGILGQFIIPYVQNTLEDSGICLDYQEYAKFNSELQFNCFNPVNNEYHFSIETQSREDLAENVLGFVVTFENETIRVPVNVRANGQAINYLESEFSLPKAGETKTYTYSSSALYTQASIYTIIETKSGNDRLCETKQDTIILGRCS